MKIVKIFYDADETGPAQLVGRRLARIVHAPILNLDLCKDAIVLLDAEPSDDHLIPTIKEVLYNPYCCRSPVYFSSADEIIMLANILHLLSADVDVAYPPDGYKHGMAIVSHHHGLDPALLAESIGIDQPEDDYVEPEPSNN